MLKQKKKERKAEAFFRLFFFKLEQFETTRDSHTHCLFAALRRFYFCETPLTPSVTLLEAALVPRHAAK